MRLTAKTAATVPTFPSLTVASLIERAGAGKFTVVTTTAVLFAELRSASFPDTATELVSRPAFGAVTVAVTRALAPTFKAPKLQVTTPPAWLQLPWEAAAETKLLPAGSVSVTRTPLAFAGPLLMT